MAFARLTQIYVDLSPYARSVVSNNTLHGVPAMCPLFLHFEDDPGCYGWDYQYMYGEDLLVAPVVDEGASEWDVYLPGSGTGWVHLWDEDEIVFQGQSVVTVEAPMGNTPVFYRTGSTWAETFRGIRDTYSRDWK